MSASASGGGAGAARARRALPQGGGLRIRCGLGGVLRTRLCAGAALLGSQIVGPGYGSAVIRELARQARDALVETRQRRIVRPFHRLFYESGTRTWSNTRWLGTPAQKCPFDLWVYQELLHELRPEVIVECGTADGGSAHFLASICDLLGSGEIVRIDIRELPGRPAHGRVTYLTGSSIAPEIVDDVRERVEGRSSVLVLLDSNHERDHALAAMRLYGPLVTPAR